MLKRKNNCEKIKIQRRKVMVRMHAEVEDCPKGWGRVNFGERHLCPISGAPNCRRYEAGAKAICSRL